MSPSDSCAALAQRLRIAGVGQPMVVPNPHTSPLVLEFRNMSIRHAIVLVLVTLVPAAIGNGATIDLFESAHSAETSVTAPPTQGVGSVANPTLTAIGVERDLFVSKTSGADDERLRARVNPADSTKLRIDADAEVTGSTFVTWDGIDGNPDPFTGIDFNGLGGVNLTAGGDAFELIITFSDVGGPIKFSVFDNTANSAASVALFPYPTTTT